ncbi:IQ-domain 33 [Abeliophyllum distichum]|uniref:IQ-domain 33 n=1 Tax=Abeliophyllum distichum TaxID=126358 RepID=A0ABD1T0X8_9LAMI
MGITGEMVRSVFLKSRSLQTHESHARSYAVEKKRWSSVRSYLCGDEFSSIVAEDDFSSSKPAIDEGEFTSVYAEADMASIRSSEATVNQPLPGDFRDKADAESNEVKNGSPKEKQNSTYKLFQQEDAAMIIQSAFRIFLERRANEGMKLPDCKKDPVGTSRESMDTSIEVQTGNSSDIFSFQEESIAAHHPVRHKSRAQVLKLQEDWDDSTVSSVISKLRIQNKMEAATRRERALAYAFSQQLRICSKKKQIKSNSNETGVGWSWLDRWMATRLPENTMMEDQMCKQIEAVSSQQTTGIRKRLLDVAMEEESCGSNEVSLRVEVTSVAVPKDVQRPTKNRNKATRNVSKRCVASSNLCPKESKDIKKVCHLEDGRDKRKRPKQPGNKREIKNTDCTCQVAAEIE